MKNHKPDFFELDKLRLDEEWVEQPRLYHEYALKLADARRDHERAKTDRDLVEAELDQAIRQAPGKFGLEKITERAVAKVVLLAPQFRRAELAVIDSKHAMDVLEVSVRTLEHRKSALEQLCGLEARDYFSRPRAPKGEQERLKAATRDEAFRSNRRS